MAIKVCQLHIYRTASLHLCYQFSDLHLCYYLCKIKYSHAASYMIVKITQNIALQGNMSCSILRSLYSYQLHHTAYYYMLKHVIAFLVISTLHRSDNACVRDSPNGTVGNFTNGTATIGNQRTLNVYRQQMVPLVPMLPLVETLVPLLVPMVPLVSLTVSTVI